MANNNFKHHKLGYITSDLVQTWSQNYMTKVVEKRTGWGTLSYYEYINFLKIGSSVLVGYTLQTLRHGFYLKGCCNR